MILVVKLVIICYVCCCLVIDSADFICVLCIVPAFSLVVRCCGFPFG